MTKYNEFEPTDFNECYHTTTNATEFENGFGLYAQYSYMHGTRSHSHTKTPRHTYTRLKHTHGTRFAVSNDPIVRWLFARSVPRPNGIQW